MESGLSDQITGMVARMGDLGVFIAMFLESSIVPIPSEVIVVAAGAMGIPRHSIVIFGALGSTLGGIVGYLLGRYAALPVILRFGKYVFIKPHHIERAEAFARKYGVWSVLIGRLIPVVPFKVFSITAGIVDIPLPAFILCTLIGVVPRIYILALFGSTLMAYKKEALIVSVGALVIWIAFHVIKTRKESWGRS